MRRNWLDGTKQTFSLVRQNFASGLEKEGAAVAVFHDGRPVVDVWAGYVDKANGRHWQEVRLQAWISSSQVPSH